MPCLFVLMAAFVPRIVDLSHLAASAADRKLGSGWRSGSTRA